MTRVRLATRLFALLLALFLPFQFYMVAHTQGISCVSTICSGSSFNGGTVSGATTFSSTGLSTGQWTFGTAADAGDSIVFNVSGLAGCAVFEGSTANTVETCLMAGNPGSDVTITLPSASGTMPVLAANQSWSGTQTFTQTVYYNSSVEAVTTTKTGSSAEGNETYTNTGDADGATFTLTNDPAAGYTFNFAVTVAQTLTIVPSTGETLFLGADGCVVSITSNTIGSTLTIRSVTGGSGAVWMSFGTTGTWVCNDV